MYKENPGKQIEYQEGSPKKTVNYIYDIVKGGTEKTLRYN